MARKLTAMLLLAAMLIAVCAAASASTTYYVTGNSVRVRSGPGTDYEVLYHLNRGAKIYIEKISHGWGVMRLTGGYNQDGYISAKYISRHKPTSNPTPAKSSQTVSPDANYRNFVTANYTVMVNPVNSYVNMRWAASKASQVRRVYYYGAQLKVIAENGTWCQVMDESTGEVGFILKSLLLRTESANNG